MMSKPFVSQSSWNELFRPLQHYQAKLAQSHEPSIAKVQPMTIDDSCKELRLFVT